MHKLLFDFLSKYITLDEEEKDSIISLNIFRSVKKGTILLETGDYSRTGYFVLKGCIRKYYVIDGEEKSTMFYTEMEGITPHCVISKEPSEYSIDTVEDSIITESTPDMETEVFKKFPKFETLCRLLSEDLLARQQISLDDFKTSSPEQR